MIDDDGWEDYTDEKVKRLEGALEYHRRVRFLRFQGFSVKQIAKHLNGLGVKNTYGRTVTMGGVHHAVSDVTIKEGHGNRGRQHRPSVRQHETCAKYEPSFSARILKEQKARLREAQTILEGMQELLEGKNNGTD